MAALSLSVFLPPTVFFQCITKTKPPILHQDHRSSKPLFHRTIVPPNIAFIRTIRPLKPILTRVNKTFSNHYAKTQLFASNTNSFTKP
jgi:hypothetical protein